MEKKTANLADILETVKSHNTNANLEIINKAHSFAEKKSAGILEETGRELFTHLQKTAQIVSYSMMDELTVSAALLHDLPSRANVPLTEIQKEFGDEISEIVKGLNKIVEIEEKNIGKIDARDLTMIVLAVSKDIRSIFLRLATRTERLREIEKYPREFQEKIAGNTLAMYAPLCHKIGLDKLEWEMEDRALKILDPDAYGMIKNKLCIERTVREQELSKIVKEISELLEKNNFKAAMQSRAKNFYSIYKKIQKGKTLADITDLRGIRIICDKVEECYEILGLLHSNYLPAPKNFHDYIAAPKENKYKSIHSSIYWKRKIVEIQLRTWEMHFEAETGIAAHWRYKQYAQNMFFDKKLSWAKQLVDWQSNFPNSKDFLKSMKMDFAEKQVFVFTPKKKDNNTA